jgi:hypothetical protein
MFIERLQPYSHVHNEQREYAVLSRLPGDMQPQGLTQDT